jgi:hypothetical protein
MASCSFFDFHFSGRENEAMARMKGKMAVIKKTNCEINVKKYFIFC